MNTREREVIAAARALAVRYQRPGEDVIARFERVAEMFRRETGFMAPGKDAPAAAYAGEDRARERDDAWNAWSRKPVDDLVEALAAYDALLAEGSASSEGAEAVAFVGSPAHVALWDAIAELVEASGGRNVASVARMSAVPKVERAIAAIRHPQPAQGEPEVRIEYRQTESDKQRGEAWEAVCGALDDASPGWRNKMDGFSPMDRACAAIRALSEHFHMSQAAADAAHSIKVGEVLTQEQWDGVCAFVREQDGIIRSFHEQRSCEGLDDGEAQRASAWLAVVSVLNEVAPTWHRDSIGTGREQVCAAIRALAQRASERRPIADEVVERAEKWVCDHCTDPTIERVILDALTLPRGLPAGSDAHDFVSRNGGEWCAVCGHSCIGHEEAATPTATAEQPSCGQDARDAARLQWSIEHARWIRHEHEAYVAIPVARDADLSCKATRISAIDAAIAAQQRQGEQK